MIVLLELFLSNKLTANLHTVLLVYKTCIATCLFYFQNYLLTPALQKIYEMCNRGTNNNQFSTKVCKALLI